MTKKRSHSTRVEGNELSVADLASVRGGAGVNPVGTTYKENSELAQRNTTTARKQAIIQTGLARTNALQKKFAGIVKNIFESTPIGALVSAAVTHDPKKLINAAVLIPGVGPAAQAAANTFGKPLLDGKRGKDALKAMAVSGAIEAVSAIPVPELGVVTKVGLTVAKEFGGGLVGKAAGAAAKSVIKGVPKDLAKQAIRRLGDEWGHDKKHPPRDERRHTTPGAVAQVGLGLAAIGGGVLVGTAAKRFIKGDQNKLTEQAIKNLGHRKERTHGEDRRLRTALTNRKDPKHR